MLWDAKTKKFVGNVDYGKIVAEKQDTTAENALVVMAVGLKQPWCYPVAYFLVKGLSSKTQTQIIRESLNLLTDAGLDVHTVVFHGCSKNIATVRRLGCIVGAFDGSFPQLDQTKPSMLFLTLTIC